MMKNGDEIPTPAPADIEAVLAGIRDGSNVFDQWLKLDRADLEANSDFGEAAASVALGRTLYWAEPVDPSNTIDENSIGGGRMPAEAAAAAWVHHVFGGYGHWPAPADLCEHIYPSFPRRVPHGWTFDLFDVPRDIQ